ncbi:MAG: efflux RND transporter periplasmic adaptor subunit, partial [Nitrospira sp.]|nr:efflux RND transporter periplasmic adaptor subunit [Nitrospira sp.]
MTRRRTTIGLLTILVGLLSGCGDQGTPPSKPAPATEAPAAAGSTKAIHPPQAVQARLRTEPAALRAVPELITAPGEVALDLKQVAKITSRIGGQVEQIHVQLGDRVKKGQALVAIGSLQLD